jgi:hypothetical protein
MTLFLFGVALSVAVYLLLFRKTGQWIRRHTRDDFSRDFRALLVARKVGAILEVFARGHDFRFEVRKIEEANDGAVLMMRIPRAPWSVPLRATLISTLSSAGYAIELPDQRESSMLLDIRVPVESVWDEWSGASSARAAHLILDAASLPKNVTFDLRMSGAPNWAWVAREWDNC